MKTNNTVMLYENLRRKGINVERGNKKYLDNYSYYQVINAYKALFITDVKSISDIKSDIFANKRTSDYLYIFNLEKLEESSPQDIFLAICKKISMKYDGDFRKLTLNKLEILISDKKYLLHMYGKATCLSDFIRLYQFEHSLRNLLLKYVLRIEEDIKAIFCRTLNNDRLDSNFLLDINNYDVSNNDAMKSLIKLLQKRQNKYSKPIKRKITQNLITPYWILINELTMGELAYTIKSLKPEYKNKILDELVTHFTVIKKSLPRNRSAIINLISDISSFRNDLAHNNPIYQYNVYGINLAKYPKIDYLKPKISRFKDYLNKPNELIKQKNHRKKQILSDLSKLWGSDQFTSMSVKKFNINLSYIIYLLYKMTYNVNPDTNYKNRVIRVYSQYHMIKMKSWGTCEDVDMYWDHQKKLKDINKKLIDIVNTKTRHIKATRDTKNIIKEMKNNIREIRTSITTILKQNTIKSDNLIDNPFPYIKRYSAYTGIDNEFLENKLI